MDRYDIILGKKPIFHSLVIDSYVPIKNWPDACCDPKHCVSKLLEKGPDPTEIFSERLAQRASWPSFREREKDMRKRVGDLRRKR
jgi:hypothetical protein